MKFFSSNHDGNYFIAITIAIENFFRSDRTLILFFIRTLMEIFSTDPDENFRPDIDAPLKKIFDALGGFRPLRVGVPRLR